jgi:hypothetical protein
LTLVPIKRYYCIGSHKEILLLCVSFAIVGLFSSAGVGLLVGYLVIRIIGKISLKIRFEKERKKRQKLEILVHKSQDFSMNLFKVIFVLIGAI